MKQFAIRLIYAFGHKRPILAEAWWMFGIGLVAISLDGPFYIKFPIFLVGFNSVLAEEAMTNPESHRAAFEAWAGPLGFWIDRSHADPDEYAESPTQGRWEAWLAAKSEPLAVTEPCTICHCHQRAMAMLGDQRIGVTFATQDYSTCKTCGTQLTLHFWERPGGPPGNGYGPCPKCNPPVAALSHGGE